MVFSSKSAASITGQGSSATSVAWPSAAQHSSARCGIIGWNSRTMIEAASRIAQAKSGVAAGLAMPPPSALANS
jgi:hypothetical protein